MRKRKIKHYKTTLEVVRTVVTIATLIIQIIILGHIL